MLPLPHPQDVSGGALLAVFECCEAGRARELEALLEQRRGELDVNAPGPDGDTALNVRSRARAVIWVPAPCVPALAIT